MSNVTKTSPQGSRKSSGKIKKQEVISNEQATPVPNLEETFTKSINQQSELHLRQEHQTKLQVQAQVHRAKLDAIWSQLQMQLFKIWNDLWLQRQKMFDQSHKEWLKVFTS